MSGYRIHVGTGVVGKDGKFRPIRKPRDAAEARRWASGGSQKVKVVKPRSEASDRFTGWIKRK